MSDLTCSGCGEYAGTHIADRIEELEELLKAATDDAKEAEAYIAEVEALVCNLFTLLGKREESDEGRTIYPNRIVSSRALDAEKLGQTLADLKQLVGIDN